MPKRRSAVSVRQREDRAARPSPGRLPASEQRLLGGLVRAGSAGLQPSGSDPELALLRRGLARRVGERLVATDVGRARATRDAGGETGFLAQHHAVERRSVATEAGLEALLVDLDESPLGWLARRKGRDGKPLLAPAEVAAGEKLRADFTTAQMTPRVTANWEAAVSSGRRGGAGTAVDLADRAIAARARVARALEAVGPELSGALVDVCCFLKGLEEVERERRWPARGAKLVLGLGLARLARHYGLTTAGSGPGRILAWGAPGSRPTIDGAL